MKVSTALYFLSKKQSQKDGVIASTFLLKTPLLIEGSFFQSDNLQYLESWELFKLLMFVAYNS